jgi:hypothetical protein
MKSAYEIAMERLEQDRGPSARLTDAQKEQIAEIDRKYDARLAEEKLSFQTRIAAAPPEEAANMRNALAGALTSIEEQRERDKQTVWDSSAR